MSGFSPKTKRNRFRLNTLDVNYHKRIQYEDLRFHEPISIKGNLIQFIFLDTDIPAKFEILSEHPVFDSILRNSLLKLEKLGIYYVPLIYLHTTRDGRVFYDIYSKSIHEYYPYNGTYIYKHSQEEEGNYLLSILDFEYKVNLFEKFLLKGKIKHPSDIYSDNLDNLEKEKEQRRLNNEAAKLKKLDKNKALEEKLKWIEEQKRIHGKNEKQ